jgi:hypothetical protein
MSDDLYAPVARFGFAVSARAKFTERASRRFLLRAEAADLAVAAITAKRSDFEDAVDRAIGAAGWTIERGGSSGHLSDFEFDRRLGVIADFTERAISQPGADTEILMRYCVTVCSQQADAPGEAKHNPSSLVIWQGRASRSIPQHSKVWVRFSCLKYRSKSLDELSPGEMRAFHDEARGLAEKIKAAILQPYKQVLAETIRRDPSMAGATLSLKTVFHIDSFTVSVQDETFPSAYRRLLLGDDLSDVPEQSRMRESLDRLKDAFDSPAQELLPVDDLGFARGVYWIDLDNTRASLVGVANNSLSDSQAHSVTNELRVLKSAPSNVIGILSGSMLASAI